MQVVLHLTKSCNLRCRYCYAPASVKDSMSRETAYQAVDFALANAKGSACVSFFGGEPLLKLGAIRELTEYATAKAREQDVTMHFRMATNGTLFDEESLRFCRDHKILFALSLDGDQEAHDAQCVLPSGKGSFELIDSKLDLILRYNPLTVVTSVITPATAPRLRSSIEYMWSRGLRYIVHQLDYTHPDWTPELFVELEKSYRELAEFYLEKARAGDAFHLGIFDDKLKTHIAVPFEIGTMCDFGVKKVSVAPDGRLFPCVQFVSDKEDSNNYCIGDVGTGFNPQRDQLVKKNRSTRHQCNDCALMGRCSNYCGCMNWQTTGEITQVPPILCAHEQMLIPIADEVGNTLFAEGNAGFFKKHYQRYRELFTYSFD